MKSKIVIISLLIINILLAISLFFNNSYDVNKDGKVDSKDLLDLRKYLINKN